MRVDYTPGPAAAEALAAMTDEYPGDNTQALIDRLVIAGASALLHQHWQPPSLHGSNRAKWRAPANVREVASKVRANTAAVPEVSG